MGKDQDDMLKFFNTQETKQEISDTYIPKENRKMVAKHEDDFSGFDNFSTNKMKKKKWQWGYNNY